MPQYLNFELHIVALEGGTYVARVLAMPQPMPENPPSHRFKLPYDDPSLERALLYLSRQITQRGAPAVEFARQFGESLFGAVFGGEVGAAYRQATELAAKQGKWLRVRLNLNRAGKLASLPWEFLRDPTQDFLALSKTTPIVRYTPQLVNISRLNAALPLRILVMISAPKDLPPVDVEAERRRMERAMFKLKQKRLVEIEYLEDASLRTLQKVLREQEFHVFHYIGHGAFNAQTGVGMLAFEDPYGKEMSYPIRGEALARELHEEETLRLVVLNSCQGAQGGADPFSGVVSSLVQRGIPAVVAQQYEISDRAAIAFSEAFYSAVANAYSLEAAVSEGRRAILTELENSEWATPVLFLHEEDSQKIFGFQPPGTRQPLYRRLFNRQTLPQVAAVIGGLLVTVMVLFLAGVLDFGGQTEASFPPPTATPIPNVDLAIKEVRLSPRNPQPGQFVAVFVDIENRGKDPSPPFTYEWQGNIFDPSSIITRRVQGIAPGGVLHDNLAYRFGWWGVFISETRLDTAREVIELSEDNVRPAPLRADSSQPFVIDFSEPLPNGEFVRQNGPVPFDAFAAWGFQIEAEAKTAACRDVQAWFKFVGISQIALGTGLPNDMDQCADQSLVITFSDSRPDNNPSGVSSLGVEFPAGGGRFTLQTFRDAAGQQPLDTFSGLNSRRQGLTLLTAPDVTGFAKVLKFKISAEGAPLTVTRLTFTAP